MDVQRSEIGGKILKNKLAIMWEMGRVTVMPVATEKLEITKG